MISAGVRVAPKSIFYSISKKGNDEYEILTTESIIVPTALDVPEQLRFVRNTFYSILLEYKVTNAGIRTTEANAQTLSHFRLNLEGVIQELLANSFIEKYFSGNISTIASLLQEDRPRIKSFFTAEEDFWGIDGWANYKSEERESIVTSMAAFNVK